MITYLLNFILCSGLLLLVYRAFLGAENLYRFNRFYLLFSLVFSLLVPAVTIHTQYAKNLNIDRFFATNHQASKPSVTISNALQAKNFNQVDVSNQMNEQALTQVNYTSIANVPAPKQTPSIAQSVHYTLSDILLALYGAGALLLVCRFVRNAYRITQLINKNKVIEYQDANWC